MKLVYQIGSIRHGKRLFLVSTYLLGNDFSGGEFSNWDVLIGSQSLAHVLEMEGFNGLPSETFPKPGELSYFEAVNVLEEKTLFNLATTSGQFDKAF